MRIWMVGMRRVGDTNKRVFFIVLERWGGVRWDEVGGEGVAYRINRVLTSTAEPAELSLMFWKLVLYV